MKILLETLEWKAKLNLKKMVSIYKLIIIYKEIVQNF